MTEEKAIQAKAAERMAREDKTNERRKRTVEWEVEEAEGGERGKDSGSRMVECSDKDAGWEYGEDTVFEPELEIVIVSELRTD